MKNNLKISLIALSTILTACGGGGSGNSVPNTTLPTVSNLPTVSKEVKESNRQVTGLKTRIDITKAKPETVRSATSSRAKQYADISDVEFIVFDEGEDKKFKFNIDKDGKIVSLNLSDGRKVFNRVGNTNEFVFEGKDPDGEDHIEYIKETLTYDLKGKDLNLSYFDFGKIIDNRISYGDQEPNGNNNSVKEKNFSLGIFGGYKEREIEPDRIIESMTFTGKATGGVEFENDNNGNDIYESIELDGSAQLAFDTKNKSSTLNLNFDKWYDVEVKKSGEDTTVKFNNYTNSNNNFKLVEETKELKDNNFSGFTLSYYYDDATDKVVEAGGAINIKEAIKNGEICNDPEKFNDSNGTNKYVDFNVVFGLKRD